MAEELKNAIKQCSDLNDDYSVQVERYVPVLDYMKHMDVSHYKVVQRKDKQDVLKDVYDIVFYNGNKIVEKRKGIIKGTSMHVARNLKKEKHSAIYNFFFNLKLFSFM